MRKYIVFAGILICCLFLPMGSSAYTINDPTNDQIGDATRTFETFGIDLLNLNDPLGMIINIYTNYPEAGKTVGAWNTKPADLALDLNMDGSYETGIALTNHDGLMQGGIYSVSSWFLSNHFAPASGYSYNKNQIVQIEAGTLLQSGAVAWMVLGTANPNYYIQINPGIADSSFSIFWGTATCANDVIQGSVNVPEPATFILFGLGMIGIAAFRRRTT